MTGVTDERHSRRQGGAGARRAAVPLVAGTAVLVLAGSVTAPAAAALAHPASTTPLTSGRSAGVPTTVGPSPLRSVTYAGVRVSVPASWPVVDLRSHPTACVRFDVHAVYIGAAGPVPACPARVVGRTEAVWLAPAGTTGRVSAAAAPGTVPTAAVDAADQQITVDPASTGTTVTATWGSDAATARRIVASTVRTRVVPMRSGPATLGAVNRYPLGASATRVTGYGFDACAAPSVTVMRAWRASPYRTVGVYIGGRNRGCAQPNLTRSWMGQVVGVAGFRALPIYVGRQAPCIGRGNLSVVSYDPATARSQGAAEATDAMADAVAVGLHPGSTLYDDMEGYPRGGACTTAVLSYLAGWTDTLHGRGYVSGVYSSASGAIADLARDPVGGAYTDPDVIWTARWDGRTALFGEPYVSDSRWARSQRAKQYLGDHVERWGGFGIDVDSDYLDATVGTIGYGGTVRTWVLPRVSATAGSAASGTLGPGVRLYTACYTVGAGYRTTYTDNRWLRLLDGRFVPLAAVTLVANLPRCSLPTATLATLNVRAGPSASSALRGVLPIGSMAPVQCQGVGLSRTSGGIWDELVDGTWVSDTYLATPGRPGFSVGYPRC